MGLSRQRIHQILKRSPFYKPIKGTYKKCIECNRPFNERLKHFARGLCAACRQHNINKEKGLTTNKYRNLLYPKYCSGCGDELIKRKRYKGLCRKCHSKSPSVKATNKKAHRKYYLKNKERVDAYLKKWREDNIEKYRLYHRNYRKKHDKHL